MSSSSFNLMRKRSASNITDQIDTGLAPRKIIRVVSTPRQMADLGSISPLKYLESSLSSQGFDIPIRPYNSISGFFEEIGEEGINSYGIDVLTATRDGDIAKLRAFHNSGRPLNCSNRFGESLLHLACRRSHLQVVKFLIKEVRVPLQIVDDMGRSPLHDAFWTRDPNFELIDLILGECPDLLYVSDKRGHPPLSYARQEHWPKWVEFLKQRPEMVIPKKL